jgi:hypothetical protein
MLQLFRARDLDLFFHLLSRLYTSVSTVEPIDNFLFQSILTHSIAAVSRVFLRLDLLLDLLGGAALGFRSGGLFLVLGLRLTV